jgi:hypothetical protein
MIPEHILDPLSSHMLFAFLNLESLRITTAISFKSINNKLLKDIASAWPGLQETEFQYLHGA